MQELIRSALEQVAGLGPWGLPAFVLLYTAACVLFLPGWILTLGAGAVYGVAVGVPLVSVAATCGATAAFLVGRYAARDWVASKVARDERFRAVDAAVGREGWKIVLLTRLSPLFPFNLLNYAFGLTRVPLRDYVLASWAGMLPGAAVYVYIGSLAGEVARLGQPRARTPAEWALAAVGIVATFVLAAFIKRKFSSLPRS